MSGLEESLGEGYQQIIMGMVIFIIGAAWGGMSAGSGMTAEDVYWPAVVMLAGAMITLLGVSFGTEHEDDTTDDLQNAVSELAAMVKSLVGSSDDGDSGEEE